MTAIALMTEDEVAGYGRRRIRETFERRFSAQTMARGYESLYQRAHQQDDARSRRTA